MKRKKSTHAVRDAGRELAPEIGALLEEIEKEPVPERLLALAVQLQEALARKREEDVSADTAFSRRRASRS